MRKYILYNQIVSSRLDVPMPFTRCNIINALHSCQMAFNPLITFKLKA